jgi:hypothetical protein
MSEINNQDQQRAQRKKLQRQLDGIGWGLFFIWIGFAILTGLGWGAGLIGVGVIILVKLLVRERLLPGSSCCKTTRGCC